MIMKLLLSIIIITISITSTITVIVIVIVIIIYHIEYAFEVFIRNLLGWLSRLKMFKITLN